MYESEFEELNLQLRRQREQIFNLLDMHASAATERDSLRTQLTAAREAVVEANRRATGAETKSAWELMAKTKHISELVTRLEAATGISVRTGQPLNR
jgi:predicted  nucleic acid-binding Zn-ribbon protein